MLNVGDECINVGKEIAINVIMKIIFIIVL